MSFAPGNIGRRLRALRRLMPLRPLVNIGFFGLPPVKRIMRSARGPVPVTLIPAPQATADAPLVIVLPGIGDYLRDLENCGMAAAIQRAWPRADVLLAGLTLRYYLHGDAAQRLHADVILPARAHGSRQIWLAGASMGGMGALLYIRRHPAKAKGLVLFAPYLGNSHLVQSIVTSGGLRQWNPGPLPRSITRENYQTELWRVAHGWALHPETAQHAWLAIGSHDRLLPAARLLAPVLPPSHFLELPGGHSWKAWKSGPRPKFLRALLRNLRPQSSARQSGTGSKNQEMRQAFPKPLPSLRAFRTTNLSAWHTAAGMVFARRIARLLLRMRLAISVPFRVLRVKLLRSLGARFGLMLCLIGRAITRCRMHGVTALGVHAYHPRAFEYARLGGGGNLRAPLVRGKALRRIVHGHAILAHLRRGRRHMFFARIRLLFG